MSGNRPAARLPIVLALALALGVALLYAPALKFGFINLDDGQFANGNPLVMRGLTLDGLRTVFSRTLLGSYMPLTWLSLMADTGLYGTGATGYHLTNALLHLLNTVLLFAFLFRATGSPWKSFFAAALWGFHPLRVESVAWIAERKDVLSGFFFLLCLLAYLEWAKKGGAKLYALAFAAFAAGLLSKPMLVVTPLALLVLDLWPLNRYGETTFFPDLGKRVVEKTPWFALSALFSAITIFSAEPDPYPERFIPPAGRIGEMITAYSHYLYKTLWPAKLLIESSASSYHLSGFAALTAGVFLAALTFAAVRAVKKNPAVTAGWLWYLVTLFPVSGIITLGLYAVADHLTYIPAMGLSFLAVWGAGGLVTEERIRRIASGACVILALVLAVRSGFQLRHWESGITLFGHGYSIKPTLFSQRMLAGAYMGEKNYGEALRLYLDSLRKDPDDTVSYRDVGVILSVTGRPEEALKYLFIVVEREPHSSENNCYMGIALLQTGDYARSEIYFKKSLELNPANPAALYNYGLLLETTGRKREALENYRLIIERAPETDFARLAGEKLAGSG